jgi:predicted DNA-binding protein YlxM (UPF0122 family)
MDAYLMECASEDYSFGQIAEGMRVSRHAVIGRFRRLCERMGWQAQ